MDSVFDADEDFLLGGATTEVAVSGAVASTGKCDSLNAIDSIFFVGLENDAGVVVIFDVFVESDVDAA